MPYTPHVPAAEHASTSVSPIQRLDEVALFGTPRMWIALVGIIALIGGFLTWGLLARPPVMTSAFGVISTEGGPLEIGASLDGTVTSLFVSVGAAVEPSNTLAIILNDEGKSVRIRTPIAGTVVEIATQEGDFVRTGESLGTIQRLDQRLAAIALVPASAAGGVTPGQAALISPDSVPPGEFGFITGTVSSVAISPMSVTLIEQLLGGVAGYEQFTVPKEPIIQVVIDLDTDPANPSGFAWTIGSGPPFTIPMGSPWEGQIITGDRSPLSTLFGS